jgi:stage II sporulation protein D
MICKRIAAGLLSVALALGLSDCAGRDRSRQPAAPPVGLPSDPVAETPTSNARAAPRNWRAEGEICVRLARLEDSETLTVSGVEGTSGAVTIRRDGQSLIQQGEGAGVSAASLRELWLAPGDASQGLSVGNSRYGGRLRVRLRDTSKSGERAGLWIDNIVELEDYIAGVVASELQLLGATPAELEAQAIASRSFALAQLAARGTRSLEVRLFDGVRDQAYRGRFVPTADPRSKSAALLLDAAIQSTRGMVLIESDAIVDARFHAACGGRTADAADVFPEAAMFRSLSSVDCEICQNIDVSAQAGGTVQASAKDISWRCLLTRAQLETLAKESGIGERLERIEPSRRDRNGRWLEVELSGALGSRRISFEALRRQVPGGALGSSVVLSVWPRPGTEIENGLSLSGRGRGHGVGLCQNGSRGYAARGWSAERILAHYYSGAKLVDGR